MNSPTIEMEREAAVQKLEQYEQAAKVNPKAMRDIDRGLMEGYRLLAKGRRLVDVNDAIKHGGLNLAGIPKLAISRAHAELCRWETGRFASGQSVYSWTARPMWHARYQSDHFQWRTPQGVFDLSKSPNRSFQAMAPLIPFPLRPKFKLENYFLLWEANWHPAPPIDPYLLRPVTGSLMEIVAEWDLTPLEIAAVRAGMEKRT